MIQRDKHGNELKVGDWVLYPWYNRYENRTYYLCEKITKLGDAEDDNIVYAHTKNGKIEGANTASKCEKMPDNEQERNNLIFLRQLER